MSDDTSLNYSIGADTSGYDAAMAHLRTATQQSTTSMLLSFTSATGGINRSMTTVDAAIGRTNSALSQGANAANTYGQAFGALKSASDIFNFISASVEGTTIVVRRLKDAIGDAQGRLERLLALASQSRETGASASFITALTQQFRDMGAAPGDVQSILANAREAARVRQGEGGEGTVNASAFQNRLTQQAQNLKDAGIDRSVYDNAQTLEEQYKAVLDIVDKLKAARAFSI